LHRWRGWTTPTGQSTTPSIGLRAEAGRSQESVAAALEVNQVRVSQIECAPGLGAGSRRYPPHTDVGALLKRAQARRLQG